MLKWWMMMILTPMQCHLTLCIRETKLHTRWRLSWIFVIFFIIRASWCPIYFSGMWVLIFETKSSFNFNFFSDARGSWVTIRLVKNASYSKRMLCAVMSFWTVKVLTVLTDITCWRKVIERQIAELQCLNPFSFFWVKIYKINYHLKEHKASYPAGTRRRFNIVGRHVTSSYRLN